MTGLAPEGRRGRADLCVIFLGVRQSHSGLSVMIYSESSDRSWLVVLRQALSGASGGGLPTFGQAVKHLASLTGKERDPLLPYF